MDHPEICASRYRFLRPWAIRCQGTVRHEHPAVHPSGRTFYQQDRDRLLHSEAFRRLGYKTQVFVVHEGDFYRTRLTHTLEVSQVARGLACALGANEDLCEAIAYAHDLGHPPFGHRGEQCLDELFGQALETRLGIPRPEGGIAFEQNFQSFRIVNDLEKRYPAFPGLNLSFGALHGILKHHTAFDRPAVPYPLFHSNPEMAAEISRRYFDTPGCSAEAQIVNLADQAAWVTHDLEDALRVRFLSIHELSNLDIPLLQKAWERARSAGSGWEKEGILWARLLVRNMIDMLITDAIEASAAKLGTFSESGQLIETRGQIVSFSPAMSESVERLRAFLFKRVYTHPVVERMSYKAGVILERLFEALTKDILDKDSKSARLLPQMTRDRLDAAVGPIARLQVVVDFLAGMTDRFASEFYRVLLAPDEKSITSLY